MENFRIAAKSFIVRDDKLLVVKRADDDTEQPSIWEIPGGRLKPGEHPVSGLKREVKEETGLDVEVLHPLNVQHFTRGDNQKITMLIFLCRSIDNNIRLSSEHSAHDWIDIKNCKNKLTEFFHKEVDIYNKLHKN
ncbi:NUDIX domain-containing protein [Candidatus Woesearchaeota archaeon]|nr:NUDIX domain-containing protein [Candidatus Woesearchaeota archaeon]